MKVEDVKFCVVFVAFQLHCFAHEDPILWYTL